MTLRHPFEWLSPRAQKQALWLLLPLTWGVMFCLQRIGQGLLTREAPYGILSFELAGNETQANAILVSWLLPGARFAAGLSLGLDYLFMPLYAASIALCVVLLSQGRAHRVSSLGVCLAWGQLIAATLDVIENYALIKVLQGATGDYWPALARNCAIPKFALVTLGILFVLLVGLVRAVSKLYRKGTG